MTQPYSIGLRERAVALAEAGMTIHEVAEMLDISPSCLPKWQALQRRTGSLTRGQIGGHKSTAEQIPTTGAEQESAV
jgi:transposase